MNRRERRKAASERRARDERAHAQFQKDAARVAEKIAAGGLFNIDGVAVLDLVMSNDPWDVTCLGQAFARVQSGEGDCVHCRRRHYPFGPAVWSHIVRVFDPSARRQAILATMCRDCVGKPDAMEPVVAMAREMFPDAILRPAEDVHAGPTTIQ